MSGAPKDQAAWPADGLEALGCCPLCSSSRRRKLMKGASDKLFGTPGRWDYWRCEKCSLVYLDPRPNKASIGSAYKNYRTHNDTGSSGNNRSDLRAAIRNDYLCWKYGYCFSHRSPLGRYVMYCLPPTLRWEWDRHARHLPRPVPGLDRLLDVGCGGGEFLIQAAAAGWSVEGVDFDERAVAIAKSRGVRVRAGSLEAQGYPSDSFDVVTLSHVIEHVHDPSGLLEECVRILKPGGLLWVATPNASSVGLGLYGKDWHWVHAPHHLMLFNRRTLGNLIVRSGIPGVRYLRRGYHVPKEWGFLHALRKGESPWGAKLPVSHLPGALGVDLFDSLFPQFQEELIVVGEKPGS